MTTSLGLDESMSLDEAFMLGYYNGEQDEHSRLGGHDLSPHHHNGHVPARSVSPSYPSQAAGNAAGGGLTEDPAAAASLSTAGDSPASDTPAGGD